MNDAVTKFMEQVYYELEVSDIPICKFSKELFSCGTELSRLKRHKENPTILKFQRIADALNMDLVIELKEKGE